MTIFDEVPTLYERFRPGYPAEAIDAMIELATVPVGGRVLEVGPGTGQLTVPLAPRGFEVTAVEAGPRLSSVLARMVTTRPAGW